MASMMSPVDGRRSVGDVSTGGLPLGAGTPPTIDDSPGTSGTTASGSTDPADAGPLVVERSQWHSGRLLLAFRGVTDRDAAQALRGLLLVVDVAPDESPADADECVGAGAAGLSHQKLQ